MITMKLWKRVARPPRHRSGKRRQIQLGFDLFEERVLLAVFTVTSNADPGTGVGNNGSLRYVINQLNLSPDPTNAINFDIGSGLQIITLGTDLPAITKQVTVDGYTEAGASPNELAIGTNAVIMVQIQMHNGGVADAGLVFDPGSEGSIVRGLSFSGADNGTFGGDAGIDLNANDVTVEGCFIGVQADGTTAGPNREGVIVHNSIGDVIGTTNPADRNLISGNTDSGILDVTDLSPAEDLLVQGNLIGTDRTGFAAIPNDAGIEMIGASTLGNTIGGTAAGAGNVISGNVFFGIVSFSGSSNCTIQGNLIGLTADGSSTLGPGPSTLSAYGIELGVGSANNVIGGTVSGAGNDIGGNGIDGILITVSATGNVVLGNLIGTNASGASLGNATGISISLSTTNTTNTIGGTATGAGNVISDNFSTGVSLNGASGVAIQGNIIGLAPNGSSILGNFGDGITLDALSSDNTVGGTIAGAGNIVSGNSRYGIDLQAGAGDTGNLIAGNIVGLDAANNMAPNVFGGISISGAGNTVGGTVAAARNVISGNQGFGLAVNGDTLVVGNYIGPDSTGSAAPVVGNGVGITVAGTGNTVGGTVSAAGNVISGNTSATATGMGIDITGSANLIEGNYVGTNAAGTAALSNAEFGVEIVGPNNTIGGVGAGAGNVISGNVTQQAGSGTEIIIFATASDNLVVGNKIGTDASGNFVIQNDGVTVDGVIIGSTGNTIGGSVAGAANLISGNAGGVVVSATGNLISGNLIGTNQSGTNAVPNITGIDIEAAQTTVGGTTSGAGNLISGNNGGIVLNSESDLIAGNFIGTDITGTLPLGNNVGLEDGHNASNNTIGGTTASAGNVISGNTADGVSLSGASGVVIEGNLIGLAANGSGALGNTGDGIALDGASGDNTIGGTVAGAGNIISGNGGYGIDLQAGAGDTGNLIVGNIVGLDSSGNAADNAYGVAVGGTGNTVGGTTAAARNVIAGNYGITVGTADLFLSGSMNLIEGNYIGTNKDGTVGELNTGVFITGSNNTIGGAVPGSGNIIGGALVIAEVYIFNSSMNLVQGNHLGTNADGTAGLQGGDGVVIDGGSNNTIGGVAAGAGNTIAFNTRKGVVVVAGTANAVLSNSIYDNKGDGIQFYGGNLGGVNDNTIGGTIAGAGNIVFGNGGYGIDLLSGSGDTGNLIAGNIVGLDASGNAAANSLGGVAIGGTGNTVGGTSAAARNVISGNTTQGLKIVGSMNLIEGNYIGTNTNGTGAVPNNGTGVEITGSNNTIGGTAAGAGNTVAFNTGNGVVVDTGTGNALLSNSIHDNTAGGISLVNGGNNNQVAPLLTDAKSVLSEIEVHGSLAVKAGTSYIVQYFGNNPASAQGRTLLGSQAVSQQPSDGTVPLQFVATATLPAGSTITAIASVTMAPMGSVNPATGDTSAFSTAATVVVANQFIVTNTTDSTTNPQIGSLRLAIEAANADVANNDTIIFEIPSTDPNYDASTGSWTIPLLAGLTIDKPESGGIQHTVFVDGLSQQSQTGSATTHPVIAIDPGPGFVGTGLTLSSGGNTVGGLVVEGFPGDGIDLNSSASGNTIVDNFIGTNVLGASRVGNQGAGMRIIHGSSNTIADNLISGNAEEGMFITVGGNSVLDNLIGTNAAGTAALGNGLSGITVLQSGGNTISGNVVSGNGVSSSGGNGITLFGLGTTGNLIQGNFIGTDKAGAHPVSNRGVGVFVTGPSNMIGGTGIGQGNVISGNKFQGVEISISGAVAGGNQVVGNKIGTNAAGTEPLGNGEQGIVLENTTNNVLSGNVISGNSNDGIELDSKASLNSIVGNAIGTNAAGTGALPNRGDGVHLFGSDNTVGGTTAGAGNTIAYNTANGVVVDMGTGNAVLSNSIHDNTAGGISLVNGGNNNQPAPLLTGAKSDLNEIKVVGSLSVKAGTSYLVQYFGNNPASAQGRTLLGSQSVSQQPSAGTVPLSFVAPATLPAGSTITAIASVTAAPLDSLNPATGDTSAFSTAAIVVEVVINPFIVTNTTDSTTNPQIGSLRSAIEAANADVTKNDTIIFRIPTTDPNYVASTGSWTILLLAGLTIDKPESGGVQHTVFVDGLSQQSEPGSATTHPVIAIDPGPGFVGTGLTLSSGGNTVGGLVVEGFPDDGIDLNSSANTIVDNFIGTDVLGAASLGNQGAGILIDGSFNTIADNLISGNAQAGVLVTSAAVTAPAVSNSILGNLIGTDVTGMQPLGNRGGGVQVTNSGGNIIGGAAAGARNIISANSVAGIEISGPLSAGNRVVGNYIGTNIDGSDRPGAPDIPIPQPGLLPTQTAGVLLIGASGNTVGGASFNDPSSNLISGNLFGIQILGNASAETQTAPAIGANAILGNKIGTNATGMQALPNFEVGVYVVNSASNAISGNLISGNGVAGIDLFGVGSSNNSISSNLIGGNAQGQASFRGTSSTKSFVSPSGILVYYGLQEQGVVVVGASNNQIGSTGGNQLVGNIETGVYIVNRDFAGNRYSAPTNNKVQNNSIQTNGIYGVLLYNSPNNPVDTTSATRNLFSGNPVNIRNFIGAVDSQKLLPPPTSTLLPPPSRQTGTRLHHKKPVKAKHPVVSHRPRVPALFPKGSHSKLVGHKPAKTH
jgi:parallel beta-helix repeat protein